MRDDDCQPYTRTGMRISTVVLARKHDVYEFKRKFGLHGNSWR